jgi:hypothetical protein
MREHLSAEQIASYRERQALPEELLRVADHVSQCPECRERLFSMSELCGALQAAGSHPLPGHHQDSSLNSASQSEHLSYKQLEQYVDGKLSALDRKSAQAHLDTCQLCSEELRDLHTFKVELAAYRGRTDRWWSHLSASWLTPRRVALAFAMTVVIALVAEVGRWRLSPSHEVRTAETLNSNSNDEEMLTAINELPPEEQSDLREVISQQRIKSPDVLAELKGTQQALLGESQEVLRFELLTPVGEVVLDPRPLFHWQPLAGASSYSVAIFDANLNPAQSSPPLHTTEWRVDRALKRGQLYLWQVRAHLRDDRSVSAPSPPSPEAKFRVLDQKRADEIGRLLQAHPKSHIALAVLCVRAGLLEQGEYELQQVAKGDPNYGLAQNLLRSIQEIRNPTR